MNQAERTRQRRLQAELAKEKAKKADELKEKLEVATKEIEKLEGKVKALKTELEAARKEGAKALAEGLKVKTAPHIQNLHIQQAAEESGRTIETQVVIADVCWT